jgi:plasmid stabilization system protein ParE
MALEVFWTQQAKNNLHEVVAYLEEHWSEKEILNLEKNIDSLLQRISKYPEMCPQTSKH